MASTGFNEGKVTGIYDGSTLITFATGSDFSSTMDTMEVTNKDSTGKGKEFLPVRYSFDISGEWLFAEDAAVSYSSLWTKHIAGTLVSFKYSSGVTGDKEYTGSAIITSLQRSAPDGDKETYSMSLQGTGVQAEAVVS